jgi:hypothetical protein
MYVVVLACGPLQSQVEDVAFLVHGFSAIIRLAGFEDHWLVAQRAPRKLGFGRHKLRTGLLEASSFQF